MRWIVCMLLAVLIGCAQNQEQPVSVNQETAGPNTPQAVTINVYNAGGNQAGKGNVTTTQPMWLSASQPAGGKTAKATAGDGSASSGGQMAGGNILITPIWIDSSSLTKAQAGSTSPRTGEIAPRQQGEQKPETQVNPAVPISIGAMPNASASTTSSFKAPATSGPQTFDQSGARTLLKAMGLQESQIDQVLQALLGSLASQPAG